MKFENVFDLIDLFSEKEIDSFEVRDGGFRLQLKKVLQEVQEKGLEKLEDKVPEGDTSSKSIEPDTPVKNETTQEDKTEAVKTSVNEILEEVLSKNVGFYHVSTPTARESQGHGEPLRVGSYVERGQTLCFVSVLGEDKELISPIDGIIRQVNFAEGSFVQYGDVLFIIEKVGE